jgi:hypothetical protein
MRRLKQALGVLLGSAALAISLEAQTVGTLVSQADSQPVGVAVDWKNNLDYMLGLGTDPVSVYDPATGDLLPVVSAGTGGFVSPVAMARWNNGLVIADSGLQKLQWVDVNLGTVKSPWTNTWINPSAVAADVSGNLYVADWNGVFALTPSNTIVTLATNVSRASALAVGESGKLWVADAANNVVKLLEMKNLQVTNVTVIGKWGTPGYTDSTIATSALFNQPRGLLWVGGQTGLLVSDYRNNVIRSVTYSSTRKSWGVTTWATGFTAPLGLARDNEGTTLVANSKGGSILSVTQSSQPTPTMTPSGGSYSNAITVAFSTTLPSGSAYAFYRTLDNTSPTLGSDSSSLLNLDGNDVTVRMRCFSSDYATSVEVSNSYSFFVAAPFASPATLSGNSPVTVTLSTPTLGARIYWTQDGSEPDSHGNGTRYTGPFEVLTNGVLKYIACKTGYADSVVVSNTISLTVADPVITPDSGTATDSVTVSIISDTPGAVIYWTSDGTDPGVGGHLYTGAFTLSKSATVNARAYFAGFVPSQIVSNTYDLRVAMPEIIPTGDVSTNNSVGVTLQTTTSEAALYWTIDGTTPGPGNGNLYSGPFTLATAGVLKVRGYRAGFTASDVASATFALQAATPVAGASAGTYSNSVTVTLSSATASAAIRYTIDGADPAQYGTLYTGPLTISTNTTLRALTRRNGFIDSDVQETAYVIQLDTPVITPPGGYYPDGVSVTLSMPRSRPDAVMYYTTDGSIPTTNSERYVKPFLVSKSGAANGDVSLVRAIAVAPNTLASAVASGLTVTSSVVGVPRDVTGGAGATVVVPVVVDLVAGQKLRSLQFRVDIVPSSAGAVVMTNYLDVVSLNTNDFVPTGPQTTDGKDTMFYWISFRDGVTNGIIYASVATNLLVTNYATVMNMKVKIPANASNGARYTLHVSSVSGTSDAAQQSIAIAAMEDRTLTVGSLAYMAGDCAGGDWYNAGDFGDGILDNADVNAIFLASLGFKTPYPGTDAFNAMDVYPETTTTMGNGLITFLDWEHVLLRSVGLETNGWVRWWAGGVLCHSNLLGNAFATKRLQASVDAANGGWMRHALVAGDVVTQVVPGSRCSIPVYVRVLPGFELAGLQFMAGIEPQGGAPDVDSVTFSAASTIPVPGMQLRPAYGQVACAWTLGQFSKPLQGSNLLGYISFDVPTGAQAGQYYVLRVSHPGGAADMDTELALESAPGQAWVLSSPVSIAPVISDEWRSNYFGSTTSADADGLADPDHDGAPNWQEYLAGTNPLDATSALRFSSVNVSIGTPSMVSLQWQTVPGRVYTVEGCSDVIHGNWSPVSDDFQGNGDIQTINQTNLTGTALFFRLRLQKP